jgi:hypothetical protein
MRPKEYKTRGGPRQAATREDNFFLTSESCPKNKTKTKRGILRTKPITAKNNMTIATLR